MEKKETCLIFDNGAIPFIVFIHNDEIKVYLYKEKEDESFYQYEDTIISSRFINIFVGGKENEDTRGCSVLFEIENGYYVFVGEEIFEFKPKSKIVHYDDVPNNSDVSFPIALDLENNVYLLLWKKILCNTDIYHPEISKESTADDVYDYCYQLLYNEKKYFKGQIIEKFFIQQENSKKKILMPWTGNPEKQFQKIVKRHDISPSILTKDKKEHVLSMNDYVSIMETFQNENHIAKLKKTRMIHKRREVY